MSFERQKEIQAKKRQQACFTSFDRYTERYVRTLKLNEVKIPHSRYLAPNGQPLLSAFSPEVNEQSTICIARVFANVPFSRTDRKSTRLNSSHPSRSRMPSSA